MFGGHTARVTGSQGLAAAGIEVNKVRILARRSGEVILRYVADAPLKSLRADLGLGSLANGRLPDPSSSHVQPGSTSAQMRARIQKLEASLHLLEDIVQTQAQDVVGLATGFARTDNRVFVQNTASAAIHMAKGAGDGHTLCG